jgi:putative ABC transport system ATP-binding protein
MNITLDRVWKSYGVGAGQFWAVEDARLSVSTGDFVSIVGPSGSGKSTLLHLLGCLDTPTKGDILIDGESTARKSDRELSLVRRDRIGFVFQQFFLNGSMTSWQNVLLPMEIAKVRDRRAKASQALEWVGLGTKLKSYPSELSGGEQQRVAIARALANSPDLLLADEPTGSLDSETGARVLGILSALNTEREIGVVVVTHDGDVARRAKETIEVRDGRIS